MVCSIFEMPEKTSSLAFCWNLVSSELGMWLLKCKLHTWTRSSGKWRGLWCIKWKWRIGRRMDTGVLLAFSCRSHPTWIWVHDNYPSRQSRSNKSSEWSMTWRFGKTAWSVPSLSPDSIWAFLIRDISRVMKGNGSLREDKIEGKPARLAAQVSFNKSNNDINKAPDSGFILQRCT